MGKATAHDGDYLKRLVEEHEPNLTKMAEYMGVDRTTIYNYFKYDKIPGMDLIKAAQFMGHDISKDRPDLPIPRNILMEDPVYYKRLSLNDCIDENDKLKQEIIKLQGDLITMTQKYSALLEGRQKRNK